MAIKLEGVKALVARPLVDQLYFAASLTIYIFIYSSLTFYEVQSDK